MLLLVSTSDKIQIITGQAVTVDVHASYMDYNGSIVTPGRRNTAITTATTTDVVNAPASQVERNVRNLSIRNKHDTDSVDITVRHTDGSTTIDLLKLTLAAGEQLFYREGAWEYFSSSGAIKISGITGTGGGDALTSGSLSQFAPTTSLQLKNLISDETGSGALVFGTSPTLTSPTMVTPVLGTPSSGTLTSCTGLPTTGLVNNAVTYAKIQNVTANSKLLGAGSAGVGLPPAEITLGTNLSMSGTTLNASLSAAGGGNVSGTSFAVDNLVTGGGGTVIQDSGIPISSLGTLAFENTVDFVDVTGLVGFNQIDRSTTVVGETSSITLAANTKVYTTASGTLNTLDFSGSNSAAQERRLELNVTGGPYTIAIPACQRLGDTGSITSISVPSGYHELSWEYVNGQYVLADSIPTGAGTGTVTHTLGNLTSNSLVLGAGSADAKVVAGIISDGTAKITLGINTTTLGQLKLFGGTSGDATIQPAAVAGTSTVVTLPNASSTLPIFGQQITFTGPSTARTVTLPDANFTIARTDAANTFTGHQTIEGVTSTGATGTGALVFGTAPTLTNAIVGTQGPLDSSTKAASTKYVDDAVTAGGGGGGGGSGWTEHFVLDTDFTSTSTSAVDVGDSTSGLVTTSALANSTKYEFELMMVGIASTTAGFKIQFHNGGSGTPGGVLCEGITGSSAGTITTIDTAGPATGTAASDTGVFFRGFFTTKSTAGAFSLQVLKVTSGTVTVRTGSALRYKLATVAS